MNKTLLSIGIATRPRGGSIASAIAAADQALYEAKAAGRGRIVTRPKRFFFIELVVLLDLCHVDFDTQSWSFRDRHLAPDDLERIVRQLFALLPDPMGIDRRDVAWSGRGAVREHRQRNIEVMVGM